MTDGTCHALQLFQTKFFSKLKTPSVGKFL